MNYKTKTNSKLADSFANDSKKNNTNKIISANQAKKQVVSFAKDNTLKKNLNSKMFKSKSSPLITKSESSAASLNDKNSLKLDLDLDEEKSIEDNASGTTGPLDSVTARSKSANSFISVISVSAKNKTKVQFKNDYFSSDEDNVDEIQSILNEATRKRIDSYRSFKSLSVIEGRTGTISVSSVKKPFKVTELPSSMVYQFLQRVAKKRWIEAADICKEIITLQPENKIYREYLVLLQSLIICDQMKVNYDSDISESYFEMGDDSDTNELSDKNADEEDDDDDEGNSQSDDEDDESISMKAYRSQSIKKPIMNKLKNNNKKAQNVLNRKQKANNDLGKQKLKYKTLEIDNIKKIKKKNFDKDDESNEDDDEDDDDDKETKSGDEKSDYSNNNKSTNDEEDDDSKKDEDEEEEEEEEDEDINLSDDEEYHENDRYGLYVVEDENEDELSDENNV